MIAKPTMRYESLLVLVPLFILIRQNYVKAISKLCSKNKNAKKIAESSYFCLQYLVLATVGTIALFQSHISWFSAESLHVRRLNAVSDGDSDLQPLKHSYLLLELSIYVAAFILMFFETRKSYSDFWMIFVHHVTTITLILWSSQTKIYSLGLFVAQIHDVSDVFLEFSKTVNYLGHTEISKYTFLIFAITFIIPRLVIFPANLLYPFFSHKIDGMLEAMQPGIDTSLVYSTSMRNCVKLLTVIWGLDFIWGVVIMKMTFDLFRHNKISDVREKEE